MRKIVLDFFRVRFHNGRQSGGTTLTFMTMTKAHCLPLLAAALLGCSAPHGKKYSLADRQLPPVALPPAVKAAELYEYQRGEIVVLKAGGTVTVWLGANHNGGYSWRLSEIPDGTVLNLVSKEYFPPTPAVAGKEKWVFEAVGAGDVDLKLWYTSLTPAPREVPTSFNCVVSVEGGLAAVARGPGKNVVPIEKPRKKKRAPHHAPSPRKEENQFIDPIFRSGSVPLRDEHDRTEKKG
jgi:predicted secreted protein